MNEEIRDPQERKPSVGAIAPAALEPEADEQPFYRVPAPPAIGKMAWSISPWLPE